MLYSPDIMRIMSVPGAVYQVLPKEMGIFKIGLLTPFREVMQK